MQGFLVAYWFIFWQRFLRNPYLLCTSENASLWFPYLRYSNGNVRLKDDIYFLYPTCLPVLSSFYLPKIIFGNLVKRLGMDMSFRLFIYFNLLHYLLASLIAYEVFGLFGALTLTYAAYCIKPQTPSFVYTMCWMPGILLGGWKGSLCLGLAILGGYWPILVYFVPLIPFIAPTSLWGMLLGLPQIIPFLWYWPKSVRHKEKVSREIGRVPWWKFKDLFWPSNSVSLVNGVHYPEAEMYMGIAILLLSPSWWFVPFLIGVLIAVGLFPSIQRVPARVLYLMTFSVASVCSESFQEANIIALASIVQGFLLLQNSTIYPSFPFSQWWAKPSKLYQKPMDGSWPNLTGYLTGKRISDYQGSFRLR